VELDVSPALPPVLVDAAAIRSALQNLVANAVKYGGAHPHLRVSAREASARGRRTVQIAIADEGLGIPPADLPHVFEPFYRGAEALARQIHGNGLGLSIVRSIVEAHGGRVTATSTPGAGSTFTVHLPAASAEATALTEMRDAELGVRN
jgi:two-component system sensor histidine kinase BaeS